MKRPGYSRSLALVLLWVALGWRPWLVHGDVLVGTNGERFVGTIIKETATNVVFQSELAGRLTFPQSKIRNLERTAVGQLTNAVTMTASVTRVTTRNGRAKSRRNEANLMSKSTRNSGKTWTPSDVKQIRQMAKQFCERSLV